ncbi:MAG: exodeoxyribonuclease VII large subunit [Planctomycetes bacterium]|nr:exodeoxyribonuclease VII large subunit [Planctomycetota bacterium]
MSILFDAGRVPVPEDEGPETVWDLTRRLRDVLEVEFPQVWVVGQVTNLSRHSSGHVFFGLKDERASIRCVAWRSDAGRLPREMADGLEVEVRGRISVFPPQGVYQMYVTRVTARGVGRLEVAFRQLKERLEKEGLFDPARKRPLPRFPRRIGVVTSPTGAAVRDILHVLARRWPAARVLLAPSRVQGEGAADDIVRGIVNLNRAGGVDVIIIGRGGGSLEDLWPFNEERVARAIAASAVPVVSAVGHETDFSISDFVADVRAPTPSAAAEIVTPDRREVAAGLAATLARLGRALGHRLQRLRGRLELIERSRYVRHPEDLVLARAQALEDLAGRLAGRVRAMVADGRLRTASAASRLAEEAPRARLQAAVGRLRLAGHRLQAAARTLLAHRWRARVDELAGRAAAGLPLLQHRWRARVDELAGRLGALDPDRVLARGYSRTVLARTGATLRRAADARPGDLLRTHLADGDLESRVTETETRPDAASRRPSRGRRDAVSSRDREVAGTLEPKKRRPKHPNAGPTLFDK